MCISDAKAMSLRVLNCKILVSHSLSIIYTGVEWNKWNKLGF